MLPSTTDYSYHYTHYPKVYVAPRAPAGFINSIDGNLDKPCWRDVPWSDAFDDIRGVDDAPTDARPTQKTRMKIMWDDDFLYVGALLEREPQLSTPAIFTEHNSPIYQKDSDFEIFVDISGSCMYYKEFEVNAINTIWNLMLDKPYIDGGHEHSGRIAKVGDGDYYEVSLQKSSTRVLEGKLNDVSQGATWSVEVAMAYRDLMVNLPPTRRPTPGSHWRINFSRVEQQGDINWTWQPQIVWNAEHHRYRGNVNMHLPDAWGYLVFEDTVGPTTPSKDTSWPPRMAAMSLYYAQHEYKSRTGRFSERLDELSELVDQAAASPFHVEIHLNGDCFEIVVRERTCGWVVRVTDERFLSAILE